MWSNLLLIQAFLLASAQAVTLQWCQENVFHVDSKFPEDGLEMDACLKLVNGIDEDDESLIPFPDSFRPGHKEQNPRCGRKSALIFLTGVGPKLETACKVFAKTALGLHPTENVIRCPAGPERRTDLFSFLPDFIQDTVWPNSWFNFWCMPAKSIKSKKECESKRGMDKALAWVEDEIESLMRDGICSENIVLSGISQVKNFDNNNLMLKSH